MTVDVYDQLRREEGVVAHVYRDSLGYWTIGCGRLVDPRKGGRLRPDEIDHMLRNDVAECEHRLRKALPWFDALNEPRKAVLIGMCFQLGFEGLMKFQATLAAMREGRHASAKANMLRSKWASQTPERAQRMAQQWLTGEWQT